MNLKEQDIKAWEQWNKSKKPKDLSNLLNQVNPIIRNAAYQFRGNLPTAVMEADAKLHAVRAFNTYDPNKGVQLSTHLTNYLKQLQRTAYKHQEIYSVPETRRIKYKTYSLVKAKLNEELGREPTTDELARELGWARAEVARFEQEQRTELSESQPISNDSFFNTDPRNALLSYVYNDLSPQDKLLLEHTTGYGGKPVYNNQRLMQLLNMNQGQLSYAKKKLTERVGGATGRV